MRYAIPENNGTLAAHFGHCQAFAMFDVDDGTQQIVAMETVPSPGHEPGFLPGWLAEQGVSTIVAGGMGPRALGLFEENRVHVILGAPEETPEGVLRAYLAGNLALGDNVCDH